MLPERFYLFLRPQFETNCLVTSHSAYTQSHKTISKIPSILTEIRDFSVKDCTILALSQIFCLVKLGSALIRACVTLNKEYPTEMKKPLKTFKDFANIASICKRLQPYSSCHEKRPIEVCGLVSKLCGCFFVAIWDKTKFVITWFQFALLHKGPNLTLWKISNC